jgi:hypothetical protein
MSKQDIQCPDSGLIVLFTYNKISQRVRVYPCADDWQDMGADLDTIAATWEWIKQAKLKVEGRRITVEEVESALGVELGELTWD